MAGLRKADWPAALPSPPIAATLRWMRAPGVGLRAICDGRHLKGEMPGTVGIARHEGGV